MRRIGMAIGLLGAAVAVIVIAGTPRGEKQIREWLVGGRVDQGPVFDGGKTFGDPRPEHRLLQEMGEQGEMSEEMIYSARGATMIWLPAELDADPCAHETMAGLTSWPSAEVFYSEKQRCHTPETPPYDDEWMEYKFHVRATILTEDAEEISDDYYTDWLRGDNGYAQFEWDLAFVFEDGGVVSTTATIGDASIRYEFHDPPSLPDPICVSIRDPAWHGTFALSEYDGLRFQDLLLWGDPIDADDLDEYVTAYLFPSGVQLHMLGEKNTVRFTVDESMASGLFDWGDAWCESGPGDPDLRVDHAGRLWLAMRHRGNIRVYHRDSPQREWEEHEPAFEEMQHSDPSILPLADGTIMVAATRWRGKTELMMSPDDGMSWQRPA